VLVIQEARLPTKEPGLFNLVDRIGVLMALEKLDDLMGRAGSNPASTA